MARSKLNDIKTDLISDSGSVLWSFVKGEQLEYPILLNFLTDATAGYTYEAVVIEADNVAAQSDKPSTVKPSGVQTTLTVRVPTLRGNWAAATSYSIENVVLYNSKYYKLLTGVNRVSATTPDVDPYWQETQLNYVYVQFPSTLGNTWGVAPTVMSHVYGFFELRVTEPTNSIIVKTWKPLRGMIEIQFSPTDVV